MSLTTMVRDLTSKVARATGTLKDEILKWRAGIESTRKQLQHVTRAPLPVSEVAETIIPAVVAEAGAYWIRENGAILIQGERSLCAPDVRGSRQLPWSLDDPLPWGAFCAAFPDQAGELLSGLLQAVPYAPGPQSADRPALIEELASQLAEQEAAEERLIDDAAESGVVIEHRAEVVQRRQNEAARGERTARADADREAREAAINAAHRASRSGPIRSPYLQQENAERQALRNP